MNTDKNQNTIDLIYKWFLNLMAISHVLFAVRNILFYFTIVTLQSTDGESVYLSYMLAAVFGALLNVILVANIRNRPFSNRMTIFLFIINIALINLYFLFNSNIFQAFLDFLLIIIFSLVCIMDRLEAACEPGQILISHTTWGQIKNEVECRIMETLQVKGFHRPLKTYHIKF